MFEAARAAFRFLPVVTASIRVATRTPQRSVVDNQAPRRAGSR